MTTEATTTHVVTVSERSVFIVGLGRRWIARCTTCAWTTRCTDRRDRDEAAHQHRRSA